MSSVVNWTCRSVNEGQLPLQSFRLSTAADVNELLSLLYDLPPQESGSFERRLQDPKK